jgi:aryl carrier-like protein
MTRKEYEKNGVVCRDEIVSDMSRLWEEALGRPVGCHDDFFSTGGDSVAALHLVNQIHEVFGCDLSMQAVFRSPTIEALTQVVVSHLDKERLQRTAGLVQDGETEIEEGTL